MPILELFPKPARDSDEPENRRTGASSPPAAGVAQAVDLGEALDILEAGAPSAATNGQPERPQSTSIAPPTQSSQIRVTPRHRGTTLHGRAQTRLAISNTRYEGLEQHELIRLIDTLDDERSRARFRESVYISVIIWLAIAWFLFYGPRVIFHQPTYRDPIALMKEHDKEQLTFVPPAPVLKPAPKIDLKTLQALREMAKKAPSTPEPPAPQATPPPPPEVAHNVAPQVPMAPLPLPAAPKPAPSAEAPLPSAPKPSFAENSQSAGSAIQQAMRGALSGRSGGTVMPPSPGRAGALGGGVDVLSDTQGVDFNPYIRKIVADTKRNWEPLIPEEVQPPLYKRGHLSIRFTILPGGEIGAMTLETTSGDVALDRAAWGAITSEGQFPPLPKAFHGPQLELRFYFLYNEQPE